MPDDLDLISVDDLLASVDSDIKEFDDNLEHLKAKREEDTLTSYLTDLGFTRKAKGPASRKYHLVLVGKSADGIDMILSKHINFERVNAINLLDQKIRVNNAIIIIDNEDDFKAAKKGIKTKTKCPQLFNSVVVLVKNRKIIDYLYFTKKPAIDAESKIVSIVSGRTLRIRFPFNLHLHPGLPREHAQITSLPMDLISSIVLLVQNRIFPIEGRQGRYIGNVYRYQFQQRNEGLSQALDGSTNYGLPAVVNDHILSDIDPVNIQGTTEEDDPESNSARNTRKRLDACDVNIVAYEFEIELAKFEGSVLRIELLLGILEKEGFDVDDSTKTTIIKAVRNIKKWMSPPPAQVEKDDLFRTHMGQIEKINKIHKLELQWHQKYSIAMAMRKKASVLQCDVGLGKTRIAIGLHLALGVKRTLVCVEPGALNEFIREMDKLKMEKPFIIKKLTDIPLAKENATPITLIGYSILGAETKIKSRRSNEDKKQKSLYKIHTTGDDLRGLFDLVIFDECFTYDTEIMTNKGLRKIGDIVTNREDVLALSKNLETNNWEYKPVVHYFHKPYVDNLVKVEYNNGHSIICTPDHKIWTKEKGYVKAKELRNETVCFMWNNVHILQTKINKTTKMLQYEVCRNSSPCKDDNKNLQVVWERLQPRYRTNEKEQEHTILRKAMFCKMAMQSTKTTKEIPHYTKEIQEESNCCSTKDWIQSTIRTNETNERRPRISEESYCWHKEEMEKEPHVSLQRRKREVNCATTEASQSNRIPNGISDRSKESQKEETRSLSSDKVCSRPSNSRQEDSNRSRRRISQDKEMEVSRQKERIRIAYARVENVTILEQRSNGKSGYSPQQDQRVFNIDVGDNHNYVANGLLVKNCQNVKSPTSLKSKSAIRLRPARSMFMSGTVITNKMAELATYAVIGYGSKSCVSKVDATPISHIGTEIRRKNKKVVARLGEDKKGEPTYKIVHNISTTNMRLAKINDKMSSDPEFTKDYVRNLVVKVARENEGLVKNDMFRFNVKEMKVVAEPNNTQFEQYLSILDGSREFVRDESKSLARLIAMMKISECPKLLDPTWQNTPTAKQLVTRDLVIDKLSEGRSVLVFTGFTEASIDLSNLFKNSGASTFLLSNKMTPSARYKVIENFRKTPNSVAVGNIGILGKSFNLEQADVVIMSDIPWSPAFYEQAIGRILRPDQTGNPEVYVIFNRFMIDQYKFEVISSKRKTIDKYLKDKDVSVEETKHISYRDFLQLVIRKADERGST